MRPWVRPAVETDAAGPVDIQLVAAAVRRAVNPAAKRG
jgi:hypothetical protein